MPQRFPTPSLSTTEIAARCHEIQTGLGLLEVPEFEGLRQIGMAVRMSLHIQGLPAINFETLKLVSNHFLSIPTVAVRSIVELLASVEYLKVQSEGRTIKAILPTVPYYDTLYAGLGEYATDLGFNEAEQLSVDMLTRLSRAPEKLDKLKDDLGADLTLVDRALAVGVSGSYLSMRRCRGRDIVLSPTFFSENPALYADMVANAGAKQVEKILSLIKKSQGIPLSIIVKRKEIAGTKLSDAEVALLVNLAQDGAVKPPQITTSYAGDNFFMFTPTPGEATLPASKRDIYEKAMAIVSSIRQGQYLPQAYAIRSPGAVIYTLKSNLRLGKATTEATQQYRKLVHLRVAQLIDVGNGFSELRIIDTKENREALRIAHEMISGGVATATEVDDDARSALQAEQSYVESLVAAGELRRRERIPLSQAQQIELDRLFLG